MTVRRSCVEQLYNLVNALVVIREKIADGDCPFLSLREGCQCPVGDESQLRQTKPLPRVLMRRQHFTQPIQHLIRLVPRYPIL